jgi:hypothetical protein
MKRFLLISIGLILFSSISVSQDLDLNKTNVKLKKELKIDTIKRLNEIKFNYSYFSGLDYFFDRFAVVRHEMFFVNYLDSIAIYGRKSGVFSLSFQHRVNKWKYGLGFNYSNYRNYQSIFDFNYPIFNFNYHIFTAFTTFERFIYKKLYLGLHLGGNFIRQINYLDYEEVYSDNEFLPYTKICLGYQFKLSNRLNFNLELGVGGSMTNTGFSYLVR